MSLPGRPSVLVVDDEREHCDLLALILKRKYDVRTATSPGAALALAREQTFAVALVDYRMPEMTGIDFLAELEKLQPECMRLLVTAYGDTGVLGRAINEAGVYRFIAKPVDPEQLQLDIQRAIEHRQARLDLARAHGMALIGSLVGSVIHDLRNYMVVLRTTPDLLEEADPQGVKQIAHRLRRVEQNIGDLVEELLAIARGRPPRYDLAPCNLEEIVRSAVSLSQHDPKIAQRSVSLEIADDLPTIPLSRSRCDRMIGNLLRNAREATTDAGNIVVRLRRDSDEMVQLQVQDDGHGIAPEILDHIFDPMFSTKAGSGGSGFGLAICKTVVEGHRGTISCESKPGRTTFTVRLPLRQPVEAIADY